MKSSGEAESRRRNVLAASAWMGWYLDTILGWKCSWNALRCLRQVAPYGMNPNDHPAPIL